MSGPHRAASLLPEAALLPGTVRALQHFLARRQHDQRVPSLTVSISREGVPVFEAGLGTATGTATPTAPDVDCQYRIGSITKTFVGAAVMRLVDEGLVHLTDRIDEHLAELAAVRVTVAQLLSQSAGLTAEPEGAWWERIPGGSWEALAATVGEASQVIEPGAAFHYSNLSFAVLGRLVEHHRGTTWFDSVHTDFLVPLGMGRTTFRPAGTAARGLAVHPWTDQVLAEPEHDGGAMAPAGQLWSTVGDLAIWGRFLSGDGDGILAPRTVASMHRVRSVDDGDSWSSGYGLGLQIMRHDGRRLYGHSGSMPGFVAGLWTDESLRCTLAFLSNSTAGPGPGFATGLLDILAEHEPAAPATWSPAAPALSVLAEIAGPWYWGPNPFVLRLIGADVLDLRTLGGAGRGARFTRDEHGRWIGDSGYYRGEELTVVRDADGAVRQLDLNTFALTRTPYDATAVLPGGLDDRGWHTP